MKNGIQQYFFRFLGDQIKTYFGSSFSSVVCRRARVLFMLFVFVAYSGVHVLTIYMSNMAVVLQEAGPAYPSRAPEFTLIFRWGPCC